MMMNKQGHLNDLKRIKKSLIEEYKTKQAKISSISKKMQEIANIDINSSYNILFLKIHLLYNLSINGKLNKQTKEQIDRYLFFYSKYRIDIENIRFKLYLLNTHVKEIKSIELENIDDEPYLDIIKLLYH